MRRIHTTCALLAGFAALATAGPAAAQQPSPSESDAEATATSDDGISDEELLELAGQEEIIEVFDPVAPGAANVVSAADLERFEDDDIHKVLAAVPGVYIREEDGYGLRPNIGMRGTGSERSAKIALLEDGVLIAPAPYSAPAAYYFPIVTRMTAVEVLKGPASIRFGPNTVGGAVNLITKPIPREREVSVDVAGGADLYGKAHASYGESTEHLGWLIEGVKLRSDGFKQLDGGGPTGFDKNNAVVKLRAGFGRRVDHRFDVKLGYSDEVSHETYTGLTDDDFADAPYRRYAGTQLDRMDWRHLQAQVGHRADFSGLTLTTQIYRHEFDRTWRKLSGFAGGPALRDILASPETGNNAVLYAVLTGAADSTSPAETLVIGTNDRRFVSEGVQLTARADRGWLGWTHKLEAGTRVHYDRAHRYHTERGYRMMAGSLAPDGAPAATTLDNTGATLAWATHYNHKVEIGKWTVTGGTRAELIATRFEEAATPGVTVDNSYFVLIPGGGVVYQALPELGLLAGVHKGFVPVSPGQMAGVDPERSVSYEAGFRYARPAVSVETIGFFSDYGNLIGACTFSSGCMDDQIGEEFNGGDVHSYGAELLARAELPAGRRLRVPLQLAYTFQRSVFQHDFSSSNPQWGDVSAGDELPYLPAHQLHLQAGIAHARFELALSGQLTSAMRDVAGQGAAADDELTDPAFVLGVAANYRVGRWGKVYATASNVLDDAHVTSRRPYGARPGAPRLVVAGYKASF